MRLPAIVAAAMIGQHIIDERAVRRERGHDGSSSSSRTDFGTQKSVILSEAFGDEI